MALYKLPQSLAVQPQDNTIPAFSLKIDFAEGSLAGNCFAPENSNALWALIGAAISLESRVFFEIERQDTNLKFQGYGEGQLFCLFQDTYKHTINLIGPARLDDRNMDLVQVWDMRWELTYFLPRAGFYSFETMVQLGTRCLQLGLLCEHVPFPQSFSELGLPDGYC
jgi:hypothetical protein